MFKIITATSEKQLNEKITILRENFSIKNIHFSTNNNGAYVFAIECEERNEDNGLITREPAKNNQGNKGRGKQRTNGEVSN